MPVRKAGITPLDRRNFVTRHFLEQVTAFDLLSLGGFSGSTDGSSRRHFPQTAQVVLRF